MRIIDIFRAGIMRLPDASGESHDAVRDRDAHQSETGRSGSERAGERLLNERTDRIVEPLRRRQGSKIGLGNRNLGQAICIHADLHRDAGVAGEQSLLKLAKDLHLTVPKQNLGIKDQRIGL